MSKRSFAAFALCGTVVIMMATFWSLTPTFPTPVRARYVNDDELRFGLTNIIGQTSTGVLTITGQTSRPWVSTGAIADDALILSGASVTLDLRDATAFTTAFVGASWFGERITIEPAQRGFNAPAPLR